MTILYTNASHKKCYICHLFSIEYPDEWNSPDLQDIYRALVFFVEDNECQVEDTCFDTLSNMSPASGVASGPCESNLWHDPLTSSFVQVGKPKNVCVGTVNISLVSPCETFSTLMSLRAGTRITYKLHTMSYVVRTSFLWKARAV